LRDLIKRIPLINSVAKYVYFSWIEPHRHFPGSEAYWKQRYSAGRNSGDGSYQKLAEFKAQTLHDLVQKERITSVVEFGCGDGNQLKLSKYPTYFGTDVSQSAIERCRLEFAQDETKSFFLLGERKFEADLGLSLDVIYHLVEDETYDAHLSSLFSSANRFVAIYSSNTNAQAKLQGAHIRHRKFSDDVQQKYPQWKQVQFIANEFPYAGDDRTGSFADFYFYKRTDSL
jgi:SAM-dependent methyltransferase